MTKGLEYRIQQSIKLLRKTEKLAKIYDPENGFYLAFSGGKDSQALYHIAQMAGVKFKPHFSPTSIDPPQLIRFIRTHYPDVEFKKLEKSMYQMALEKRLLPTMNLRWCCAEFKEASGVGKVTLIGIRHQESVRRAKRKEVEISGHKFSGTLDEFQEYRAEVVKKKLKHINHDEFTADKEQEVRCIGGKDTITVAPIIDWTTRDVWEFLNDVVKVPHCELYDPPYNQHRIGCILCPMSPMRQKKKEMELWPHVKANWIKVIEKLMGDIPQSTMARTISLVCLQRETGEASNEIGWRDSLGNVPNLTSEDLFNWWISGEPFEKWYSKYTHPKLF